MGCSVAHHLALLGCRNVLVVERESLLGMGATGRCAGGFRHQFSTAINIRLSQLSIPSLLHFEEETGHPLDVHQDGYLFLLSTEEERVQFRTNIALQNSMGVRSSLLDARQAQELVPGLQLDGIVAAAYCPDDGIADPGGVVQGYAGSAARMGVNIVTGTDVVSLETVSGRIAGVKTSGGYVATPCVVNATGPWAAALARKGGIDLPVTPVRRHVFTTHPFAEAPNRYTLVIDFHSTFYFHRESGGVLMGMARQEPPGQDQSVDWNFLPDVLGVALDRYPPLAAAGIARAWAGLYEVSPDALPILGQSQQVPGFYFANGFSGHGFQHAPAVGRLLAELIVYGETRSLDIASLSLERFAVRERAAEYNVV